MELFERHGKEVEEASCISMDEAVEKVCSRVNLGEEGFETAAVITMTEWEQKYCIASFKKQGWKFRY